MLLELDPRADPDRVKTELLRRGASGRLLDGPGRRVLLVEEPVDAEGIDGVVGILRAASAHPLVDAAAAQVDVAGVSVGAGAPPCLIAGPCAVESEEQLDAAAAAVAAAGARILRGGAFKPRTSPYAFRGLGRPGLALLAEAGRRHGLAVVTEVMSAGEVDAVAEHADLLQVGSRTMQAFDLLDAVGAAGKPVLLKRGMAATVDEWLLAAEYLLVAGASGVILCERGIRTFTRSTRHTLDLGSVAHIVAHHRLPVIVDPSHAAGRRDFVAPLALAGVAAGAHGLMIEVHPKPETARCDALQALSPEQFAAVAAAVTRVTSALAARPVGRRDRWPASAVREGVLPVSPCAPGAPWPASWSPR